MPSRPESLSGSKDANFPQAADKCLPHTWAEDLPVHLLLSPAPAEEHLHYLLWDSLHIRLQAATREERGGEAGGGMGGNVKRAYVDIVLCVRDYALGVMLWSSSVVVWRFHPQSHTHLAAERTVTFQREVLLKHIRKIAHPSLE